LGLSQRARLMISLVAHFASMLSVFNAFLLE
jgi:hypothetical protein